MTRTAVLLNAAALGAVSGMRTMAAPALMAHEMSRSAIPGSGKMDRVLSNPGVARILSVLAAGELVADKTPYVPDRIGPGPLSARIVMGSLVAAVYALHKRERVLLPMVVGGAAALGSSFALFHARRLASNRLGVPDGLLGLAEDAIVLLVGKRVGDTMNRI